MPPEAGVGFEDAANEFTETPSEIAITAKPTITFFMNQTPLLEVLRCVLLKEDALRIILMLHLNPEAIQSRYARLP
jgi:hypothetical protein